MLRAIEASYLPEPDLHQWLEGICSELDGLGLGTWGSIPVSNGLPVVGAPMILPETGLFMRVNERAAQARETILPLHTVACIPEQRVINARRHWMHLTEERGVTVSEALRLFGHMVPDATAVSCTSTNGHEGVVALLDSNRPIPARVQHQLEALAAHVEHAYRLRSAHRSWTSSEARAVLSPEGKLLHAEPEASQEAPSLAHAVKESEKESGRMRRMAPEEAIETWKAMVEGQWSLAEHVERDGKRLLLAFENSPATPALKLSSQEKRVISYAAIGHQQKYIAYELGMTPSSVSRSLSSALGKLRLKNQQAHRGVRTSS